MCLVVYLASDAQVQPVNLVDNKIGFSIYAFKNQENHAFQNFSKRLIYYIGSAEGCGCGFLMDGVYPEMDGVYPDVNEFSDARETYRLLSEFLQKNIADAEFEIYSCWVGQEGDKPIESHRIKTADISKTDFAFEEGHFYTVNNY